MHNMRAHDVKAPRSRRRSRTAIAAVTLAAGLTFGFGAPAMAQSPGFSSPGLNSPGLNSPGLKLPESSAPKVKLGTIGGPAWSADVYSQIIRGKEVRPGDEVTIRIEVVGVNGNAKLRGIGHNIPADFKLVRVTRQSQDNVLGGGIYTLKEGEYEDTERNGNRQVRLSWKEGGFLGYFQDNPTVNNSKSVAVDFTYKAPDYEGEFDNGGYAYVGSVLNPNENWVVGGEKVVVKKAAKPSWWPF
ncbi:hypothetical protein [uncultured Corynebacterium sp.]|uniref:hypothetical protein n=1 Tax=uncultured Corynebacterium sp. TaxID=159447 RepID=UPI00263854C9|nr:hypothetical protein [uncultured Corynebacterium sp.]